MSSTANSSTGTAMAPIAMPSNLPALVRTTFNKALANGDVNFYPTQVTLLNINSIPFQLRFSPSLASKPKPPPSNTTTTTTTTTAKPPFNPFFNPFLNPSPALLVSSLPPNHNLILNKFAIVPEHFILATKTFRPQTHLLDAADLAATHACVEAYHAAGEELFVFFNSGEHSGASQPHRHLQLLGVERMREGLEGEGGGKEWGVIASRLGREVEGGGSVELMPFRTFAEGIHAGMDGEALREVYLRLYRKACEALGRDGAHEEGEARICYNMAMMREVMVVMPRVAEGAEVRQGGKMVGKLALNGTVLAGTALVKTQAEWDALRNDPEQVTEILKRIGVPTESGTGLKL